MEEIVVTARKREETTLQVPVTLQAFTAETLAKSNIHSFDGVARLTPGLIMGEASGGPVGGSIFMRGIGSGESNTFIDQAIAFNVDGMHITRAAIRRLGFFDVNRVEVLKGPQSLYFGRNSSGGIIALVSADPTPEWDAQVKVGYETEAKEAQGEAYVSGPINKTLSMRIAAFGSKMDGWIHNDTVATPNLPLTSNAYSWGTQNTNTPNTKEYGARIGLKYDAPNAPLTFKIKSTYGYNRNAGVESTAQLVYCPYGAPQLAGSQFDACQPDHHNQLGDLGPLFKNLDPRFGDGRLFVESNQYLTTAEAAYDITPALTLTSLSGYYYYNQEIVSNSIDSSKPALGGLSVLRAAEFSQELRLQSNFSGRLNFMLDAQYNSVQLSMTQITTNVLFTGGQPTFATSATNTGPQLGKQNEDAMSVAAQLSYDITKKLNISGGARWSQSHKDFSVFAAEDLRPFYPLTAGQPWHLLRNERVWAQVSPEVTISYKPTPDYNFYASWKEGFKAGGFAISPGFPWLTQDPSYAPERVEGPEIGLKARITPDLRVDLAGFIYKVNNLQVSQTIGIVTSTINAGSIWTKGVELNFNYEPHQIRGLRLNGGFAYDHARYREFINNCYNGQNASTGCYATPIGFRQNLSGRPALRAPDWAADIGVAYDMPLGGSGYMVGLAADATYTSSFYTDLRDIPGSRQKAYYIAGASARVYREDHGWELAIIGKNLNDKQTFQRATQQPGTGSAFNGSNSPLLSDIVGTVSRGREIWIQLTFKPFDLMRH